MPSVPPTNGPRSSAALSVKDRSALQAALTPFRDQSYSDFLKGDYMTVVHQGRRSFRRYLFFATFVDGALLPIDTAPSPQALWREIETAVAASGGIELPGLVLDKHLVLIAAPNGGGPATLICVADAEITAGLGTLGGEGPVTPTELRLVKQLVCGYNLAEAARADDVGHETKRTHYKALARKLGVRSQAELTTRVLSTILIDLPVPAADTVPGPDDVFDDLMREYVPDVRTFHLKGSDGRRHRFLDIGPVSGRPVVMVHSQILPDFRAEDIRLLAERGLRIIVPLRYGALSGDVEPMNVKDHLDHACEAIDLARSHFCGEKCDLVANVSGCAYSIEYARRKPARVVSLVMIGACVNPTTDSSAAGRMRAGLLTLARHNWTLYAGAVRFIGRRFRRPEAFRRMMSNLYRDCPADRAFLAAEFGNPERRDRARQLFCASLESVKHDFFHQSVPRWDVARGLNLPIHFIHGKLDTVHRIEEVERLASSIPGARLVGLDGAGQLLYHEHFAPVINALDTLWSS